jgi:multiple sugar transport system permease protein
VATIAMLTAHLPRRRPASSIRASRRSSLGLRRLAPIYLLLLPGMALYLIWALYPLGNSLLMSFFHWNLIKPSVYIGLDNYTRALGDPVFWQALRATVGYTVVTVAGQLILGMAVALLLNQDIPGRSILRLVYYLPVVTSWVIVSLVFVYLYNGQAGALNWLLHDVLHVTNSDIAWLADPTTALWAIAVVGIWKGIGWTMVVLLAGLQGVSPDLLEAAQIDGAGSYARFRHVTLPSLRPTLAFLLVVLTIGGFNVFVPIFVMSSSANSLVGGPLDSTHVALTYMYQEGFSYLDLGYAAALSYLLVAVLLVVSVFELRFARRHTVLP